MARSTFDAVTAADFEPVDATDPASESVRRSLPKLFGILIGRSDAHETPYTGRATTVVPRLAAALITVRAALRRTLNDGEDTDRHLDDIMRRADVKLHALLVTGSWLKRDGTAFEPWAALVLHSYTMDQHADVQRVALHGEINRLLHAAWGPDVAASVAARGQMTRGGANVRLADYVKLLFEAADTALVAAGTLYEPLQQQQQQLHRHILRDLGDWPEGTTRQWPMFTSTSLSKDTALDFRVQARANRHLGDTSTLCCMQNRALEKLSYIASVSAFPAEGEVLLVPGIDLLCERSHYLDPAAGGRSGLLERDLYLRIVGSTTVAAEIRSLLAASAPPQPPAGGGSGSGSGSAPPSTGDGPPPPSAGSGGGGDDDGRAPGTSNPDTARARQMAQVAVELGIAAPMLAYLDAAMHGSDSDEATMDGRDDGSTTTLASALEGTTMSPMPQHGADITPSATAEAATTMGSVAVAAGFGEAMASCLESAARGSNDSSSATVDGSASGTVVASSEGTRRSRDHALRDAVAIAPGGIRAASEVSGDSVAPVPTSFAPGGDQVGRQRRRDRQRIASGGDESAAREPSTEQQQPH